MYKMYQMYHIGRRFAAPSPSISSRIETTRPSAFACSKRPIIPVTGRSESPAIRRASVSGLISTVRAMLSTSPGCKSCSSRCTRARPRSSPDRLAPEIISMKGVGGGLSQAILSHRFIPARAHAFPDERMSCAVSARAGSCCSSVGEPSQSYLSGCPGSGPLPTASPSAQERPGRIRQMVLDHIDALSHLLKFGPDGGTSDRSVHGIACSTI